MHVLAGSDKSRVRVSLANYLSRAVRVRRAERSGGHWQGRKPNKKGATRRRLTRGAVVAHIARDITRRKKRRKRRRRERTRTEDEEAEKGEARAV